jgi:hypothetical protein
LLTSNNHKDVLECWNWHYRLCLKPLKYDDDYVEKN